MVYIILYCFEDLRGRLVPIEGKIITMENVKTLATNLAR